MCLLVKVLAVLALLWLDFSVAQYSLYITEEHLQSYFSNTDYAELVQGHNVEIVRDGELLVGDDGSLLLSPVGESGDLDLNPDLGSGNGDKDLFERSISPLPQTLPPLPAHVEMVDFTWIAYNTTVNYTLYAEEKEGQLYPPMFTVPSTGRIPLNQTNLQLTLSCLPLSMRTGSVTVNLTTSTGQSNSVFSAVFVVMKSCNETESPSLSVVHPLTFSVSQDHTSTPLFLPSPGFLTTSTSHPIALSFTPTLHPLPLLPTPGPSTLGLPPSPSASHLSNLITSIYDSPSLSTPSSSALSTSSSPSLSTPLSFAPSQTILSSSFPTPLTYSSSLLLFTSSISYSPSLSTPLSYSPSPSTSSLSYTPSLSLSYSASLSTSYSPSLSTSSLSYSPSLFTSSLSYSPSLSTSSLSYSSSLSTSSLSYSPSLSTSSLSYSPSLSTSSLSYSPSLSTSSLSYSPSLSTSSLSYSPSLSTSSLSYSPSLSTSSLSYSPSLSTSLTYLPSPSTSLSYSPSPSIFPTSAPSATISTFSSTPSVVLTEADGSAAFPILLVVVCAPVAGTLLACILLVCCILVCIKCRSRSRKGAHMFNDDPRDVIHTVPFVLTPVEDDIKKAPQPPLSLWMSLPWGLVSSLPRSIQTLVAQSGVDRKSLSIVDTIIRGEYGSMVSGQLNIVRTDVMGGSQSVAIKMLTGLPEGSRRDEVIRFLEAAALMKDIQHRHILPVLRVSVEDNCVPLVIYHMAEHGDMHRVMKLAANPEHSVLPPMSTKLRLELALQIATAVGYLADYGIVHPDLALRNCLLDSNCTVKVTDGALAQQLHPECYYTLFGATRPVRWAAVETLQEGLCTSRSNVWSYAVTVWEILTFAEMPYSDVNNNRSILSTIKMGARLPRPNTCPESLYELLSSCWSERGEQRPNFTTLVYRLQQLLTQYPDNHHSHEQSQLAHEHSNSRVQDGYLHVPKKKGRSASREQFQRISDSEQHRQMSHGRISTSSMLSRGSAAEKLSVTFSVLSASDAPSGNSSDEERDFDGLQMSTDRQGLHTMFHQVTTSFITPPAENTWVLPPTSREDDTRSSINTSDISSHTLVPPPFSSPTRSPRSATAETTSQASASVTPPPSQATDTFSKTSTVDLESVSTSMSAPYSSSPMQSSYLYPTSGYRTADDAKREDHSPLLTDHKARTSGIQHSPYISPSRPSAKSTDSGIRSDEDTEVSVFNSSSSAYIRGAADVSGRVDNRRNGSASVGEKEISDLSRTLMAAFDTWGSK